jgi:polysaccharide biosynthesis/export protein
MPRIRIPKLRFSLASLFVLMLGIAIGFSLNLSTWQLLVGPGNEAQMRSLPTYVIEPPDILMIQLSGDKSESLRGVAGKHSVGPDGTVNLGAVGQVYVARKTVTEAQAAIGQAVAKQSASAQVLVDIGAYLSKTYYVIVEGPGKSAYVSEGRITGNETVLDAIAQIGVLRDATAASIWIARPAPNGGREKTLPVDWKSIASGSSTVTNFQLMPGDRVFVSHKSQVTAAN